MKVRAGSNPVLGTMAIFVSQLNVEKNESFGQAINKVVKMFVVPELKKRKVKTFKVAGITIEKDGKVKVYLDNEVTALIEFKKQKVDPSDNGKAISVSLEEIKDISWNIKNLAKDTAKIFICDFNSDWWIWDADYKKRADLEKQFEVITNHVVRGSSYVPLKMKKQQKVSFFKDEEDNLKKTLPDIWRRNITVSQKYRGIMSYDGNYFDLFIHAQELYILGYYYSSIVMSRIAAEQALVRILIKVGKALDIYKPTKPGKRKDLKGIYQLVETCRDKVIFSDKKYPINTTSAKKLLQIADMGNALVHTKSNLDTLNTYKGQALLCMDNLQYIIKNHLNFVSDTKMVSGYKPGSKSTRLK